MFATSGSDSTQLVERLRGWRCRHVVMVAALTVIISVMTQTGGPGIRPEGMMG